MPFTAKSGLGLAMARSRRGSGSGVAVEPPAPAEELPLQVTPPTFTAIPTVGQTATRSHGTYANGPILSYEQKWQQSLDGITWVDLNESGNTYLIGALSNRYLRYGERPSNVVGAALAWSYSTPIGPITLQPDITYVVDPDAGVGVPFEVIPTITGGTTPRVVTANKALPAGLNLEAATGRIYGSATTAQVVSGIIFTVTDANGLTDTFNYGSITVVAPGSAPGVTTPPSIAATAWVVGETVTITPGVFTNTPTSNQFDIWQDGAAIAIGVGLTFAITDAMAAFGKGTFTVKQTATNGSGSTVSESNASAYAPRRSYPTLAYNFGVATPANVGNVSILSPTLKGALRMFGSGASDPSNSTTGTASSGTDGHFSKTAMQTPRASAAGVSAGFNAGPYVYPQNHTWADGKTETTTITITAKANTITFSNLNTSLGGSEGTNPASLFAIAGGTAASGKIWEMALGSDFSNGWDCRDYAFTSKTVFKHADPTRAGPIKSFVIRGSKFMAFEGQFYSVGSVPANGIFYFTNSYALGTGVKCEDCSLDGLVHTGVQGLVTATYMIRSTGGTLRLSIKNVFGSWIMGGLLDDSGGSLYVNKFDIRYYHDNGMMLSDNATTGTVCVIEDCAAMSPMRQAGNTTHLDGIQVSGRAPPGTDITIRRYTFIQADGDAISQGIFYGNSRIIPFTVDGYLHASRVNWALGLSASSSTTVIKNITLWQTSSGAVSTASTENDGYNSTTPSIGLFSSLTYHTGGATLDNALIHNNLQSATAGAVATWTKTNTVEFNGSLSSPASGAGYFAANPKIGLDALNYSAMTFDAIVTAVRTLMTPRADALVCGALTSAGAWATAAPSPAWDKVNTSAGYLRKAGSLADADSKKFWMAHFWRPHQRPSGAVGRILRMQTSGCFVYEHTTTGAIEIYSRNPGNTVNYDLLYNPGGAWDNGAAWHKMFLSVDIALGVAGTQFFFDGVDLSANAAATGAVLNDSDIDWNRAAQNFDVFLGANGSPTYASDNELLLLKVGEAPVLDLAFRNSVTKANIPNIPATFKIYGNAAAYTGGTANKGDAGATTVQAGSFTDA